MALLITVGNLGGLIGSNIFLAKEAPKYPTGYGTCLAILITSMIAAIVIRIMLKRENAKRDAFMDGKTEEEIRAEYDEEELKLLEDMSPFYRYTL